MKILVTGANGFIGRAFCIAALQRGHEVLKFVRRPQNQPSSFCVVGALNNPPWRAIEAFAPEAVLHLAWIATPGEYLHSPANEQLLYQSQEFLAKCAGIGVQHISVAGTCVEYGTSPDILNEFESPLVAITRYAAAKLSLYRWLDQTLTGSGQRWSWFRIFYPYGPGEDPQRLSSYLIRQLSTQQQVLLRTPASIKDYVYIDDLALAICLVLEQRQAGPINVASGKGVSIRDLAQEIATIVGADRLLITNAEQLALDLLPVQVADIRRLRSLGWNPTISLNQGLRRLAATLKCGRTDILKGQNIPL
jgi:nucleoside-diphosphate-sugar epimerase